MIYRDFQGEKITAFAMGCMRLPVVDGNDADIDFAAAEEMVDYAMGQGVNYYDTAWGYHGGNSEIVVGKALAKYPRDSFNLASKYPGYDPKCWGKNAEIFEKQLEKCGVDYFDFYLVHNVCEMNIDMYMDDESYGTVEYLIEQKKAGRIRHLGFSAHGELPVLERFLKKYGEHMEFCQIQLNFIDYVLQEGKSKLKLLERYGLPVWVMEPLRGGMLAKASKSELARMEQLAPGATPVSWALRWLQSQPQVVEVLLGSSTLEQLKENIALFAEERPLSADEAALLDQITKERISAKIMPCTGCRYCVSHCPCDIDIPQMMSLYNEHKFTGGGFIAPMALATVPEGQRPGDCIRCGSCKSVCPQNIDIPGAMMGFAEMLEG